MLAVRRAAAPLSIVEGTAQPHPRATATGIDKPPPDGFTGQVWATIDGETVPLPDGDLAIGSWVVDDGRYVAFSGPDGSGGPWAEGQSLRVYDTETGRTSKVMSEYMMVTSVRSVKLADGRTALLVALADSVLNSEHVAIVDPQRGEVYRQVRARILDASPRAVSVGLYRVGEYEKPAGKRRPFQVDTLDLARTLSERVITNRWYSPES